MWKNHISQSYAKSYAGSHDEIHHFDLEKREDLKKPQEPYLNISEAIN